MKNLRSQLLFSHLALVALMVLVMVGSVLNFVHLGGSIARIHKDNYKSVIAAQNMKEALERQDSAATFLLAGQTEKARKQYEHYWPLFRDAYEIEAHNITERGEQQIADDIGRQFAAYRTAIEKLLYANRPLPSVNARAYYFGTLEPAFLRLKSRAQDVLDLNQAAIVRRAAESQSDARRASWTGSLITAAAFLLALFFALRMIGASLSPLRALARQAEQIGAGHLNQRIELQRRDEIGALADAFNQMTEKLREARLQEEERLQRAERMSDAALESLYDPVVVTDSRGTVVHLNRAAESLFGAAVDVVGRPIGELSKDRRVTDAIEKVIRHERVSDAEGEAGFVALYAEDRQRTYRVRATPMRGEDGQVLGAALVLEDVTHLRELDRLKTEFIGVASHELRTPVTSLLISVQALEEGAVGELTADQHEVVRGQMQDLKRLERLTRDLLDITRLESGVLPPHFEAVAPRELVEAALTPMSGIAEEKGLHLVIDAAVELPAVQADRGQIARVLVNLLDNAIRHTPAGGEIHVTASPSEGSVLFSVRDTGSGIPREYLPRIFERFSQVPGATRGGAGLGLSIAQATVEAHGSEIQVESEVGRGSTFTFSLPAVAQPPAAGAAALAVSAGE